MYNDFEKIDENTDNKTIFLFGFDKIIKKC